MTLFSKYNISQEIVDLFNKYGGADYIGEPVTQTEHMAEAALLAEKNNEDSEMVVACLLHDIGHLLEINNKTKQMANLGVNLGVIDHEIVGKNYLLSKGFSQKIANLVGNHVAAKRYLVSTNPEYFKKLSDASKQTLLHQKGFMTDKEISEFENSQLFDESLRLRSYDDAAKIPFGKFLFGNQILL